MVGDGGLMPLEGKKDSRCYVCGPVKRRRRLFAARPEIRIDGSEATLLAEADATMCLIGPESRSSGLFIYQEDSKIVNI
jgi:hypothetical protein